MKRSQKIKNEEREECFKTLAEKMLHEMLFGSFAVIFVLVRVQSQNKKDRLTSVFNVFISLSSSYSPPPFICL